ncbi:RNA-binding S4 domain-containing protein [Mesorhizobium sp. VK23B]|uniref:RNA-binding S4 domain-containing protein n=1 Tax=Mesorhizobium dulcispinae TaxID=3072316 RepID=A0ABU4X9B2_9HYPH|nr:MULTISPECIES: RNA-binding S4 domain-containing protein [unclassified Mesorhizobium]MDX8465825.1 RNA-binding S4 domain-containing protein [Mesorhizobium sp. VK23B]MDX8471373.1 RNA-binding S4 domain-containing protein [Mesorhizobium sp. VK23A]
MVGEGRQRIDKWLFFSRAVKSRSLAAKLVVAGRVRINRDKAAQASDLIKAGDVLTITLDRRILVWKVLNCGTRRGPAEEARLLYEDMSQPPTPRGEAVPDAIPALREAGSGRPTKRERRQTDRLLGDD